MSKSNKRECPECGGKKWESNGERGEDLSYCCLNCGTNFSAGYLRERRSISHGTVRLELAFRVPCDEGHRYFGTLTEAVADRDSRGEFGAIEQYDEEARIWFTVPLEAANAARPADLRFADVELRPRSSRLDFLISGDDE